MSSEYHIVIHKSRGELVLFHNGAAVRTISVSTGKNPADKTREGDLATPEGKFYVCYKNPKSNYVRFLGISYPNLEDAQRGLRDGLVSQEQFEEIRAAIERGACPPWKTALGGEIGLHGRTSHPEWTHGCISMDDAIIGELYELVPLGTTVEIFH
jgi:murein L,D-transpeptidase YafK